MWPCVILDKIGWIEQLTVRRGVIIQYIPRNMHMVFALLCFFAVIHWLIFPYPSGLLHWHCGNLTIAPVPAKQPWWIWINTSCEFFMNDCITTTKQSTTKPCAYFLGYTLRLGTMMKLELVFFCLLVFSLTRENSTPWVSSSRTIDRNTNISPCYATVFVWQESLAEFSTYISNRKLEYQIRVSRVVSRSQ